MNWSRRRSRLVCVALLLLPGAAAAQTAPRVLTLDEALRTARKNQPSLRIARATASQAYAQADEVRSALLPQVAVGLSYQRTERQSGSTVINNGSGSGFGPNSVDASVGVTQLVWDFGQTTGRLRAAKATARAFDSSAQGTLHDVLLSVRTLYYQCRATKDLVGVARDTLANQEKHLTQVQGFIKVGTQPEIALAQSKADVASARVQLITAENNYASARNQLNQAMGVVGPASFDVADEASPPVSGEDGTLAANLDTALRARPELRALALDRESATATVSATRGAYLPTLSVSGTAAETGDGPSDLKWTLTGTVNLTWNIFQGGLTRAQVRAAQLAVNITEAQTDSERLAVQLELANALDAVRSAKASVVSATEALVNARDQLRLAEGRFTTGVGSIIELGDAQVAATSAAAQKVQAEYNVATARAQLVHALGADGER